MWIGTFYTDQLQLLNKEIEWNTFGLCHVAWDATILGNNSPWTRTGTVSPSRNVTPFWETSIIEFLWIFLLSPHRILHVRVLVLIVLEFVGWQYWGVQERELWKQLTVNANNLKIQLKYSNFLPCCTGIWNPYTCCQEQGSFRHPDLRVLARTAVSSVTLSAPSGLLQCDYHWRYLQQLGSIDPNFFLHCF